MHRKHAMPMEKDHYIDSLQVDLKLHSNRTPFKAQSEADDIVDEYVVPAVESVLEDIGREIDVTIPQIEIDVGRVRVQDLRDAVESALRNALDKYRTFPGDSLPTTLAESLRDYAETGIVPWTDGDAPFHPSRFLNEYLQDGFDTLWDTLGSFSEKERVALLMATFSNVAPDNLTRVVRLRKAILDGLTQDFPETAAVLTARMNSWRGFGEMLESLSNSKEDDFARSEEVVDHRESLSNPAIYAFRYVEVNLLDIPAGLPVVSMEYMDAPGWEAPEFIVSPGPPVKYYRKVAAHKTSFFSVSPEGRLGAPKEKSGTADARTMLGDGADGMRETEVGRDESVKGSIQDLVMAPSVSFRYIKVEWSDIPAGYPVISMDYTEAPGVNDPEYIVSPGSPPTYYRKEANNVTTDWSETAKDRMAAVEELTGTATETGRGRDESRSMGMEAGRKEKKRSEDGKRTGQNEERGFVGIYRYVEIVMTDIPAGYPVVSMEYTETPGVNDPEYIVSPDSRPKYYRKEAVNVLLDKSDVSISRLVTMDTGTIASEEGNGTVMEMGKEKGMEMKMTKDAVQAKERKTGREGKEGTEYNISTVEKEETREKDGKEAVYDYRYVEISLTEIPDGIPIVLMEITDTPGLNDPEYVVSPGPPMKYYRKDPVRIASDTFKESEDKTDAGEEKGMVRDAVRMMEMKSGKREKERMEWAEKSSDDHSVWEIRDFESKVPDVRIPVSDAGLVLLHPFIGRMMENLGLVKKGMFVSPLARVRAVHLLRDLTGSDEPHHNHNLILEKVLCGLPVGYLLPPEWKPTEKEKEETEALLRAVCEYWRPLSGSSTSALCGSFILRPGTIEHFQDTWTIRVEGHTIDILLDELPWELSIIYLPWLEKSLAVEWQCEQSNHP